MVVLVCIYSEYKYHPSKYAKYPAMQVFLFYVQMFILLTCTYLVYSTESYLARKEGLPYVNQVLSWTLSIISLILPLLSSSSFIIRFRSLYLGFASPFVCLSIW